MRVLIRTDASMRIGSGHLVRTRTLARELMARGAKVTFACRRIEGNQLSHLQDEGFAVRALSASVDKDDTSGVWSDRSQHMDAIETVGQLEGPWDWVFVDHYGLDGRWETTIRPYARRVMVIDDLANRRHDCDLLLDQNFAQSPERRYVGLVPADCRLLLGPRYALIRPEYAQLRAVAYQPRAVETVFVFFSGSTQSSAVNLALAALSLAPLKNLQVDVVVGSMTNLELQKVTRSGRTTVHCGLPHLAQLMADADIAVGAGGATTWERMCMGLPSIVASIAKNQEPACTALFQDSLIRYLGPLEAVTVQDLATAISNLAADTEARRRMAVAGMDMVDGRGTRRVANAIIG